MMPEATIDGGEFIVTPTSAAIPAASPTVSDQSWFDKYQGLQGAFKARTQQLTQEVEGLKATKGEYETQLAQLRASVTANEAQLQELPTVKETLSAKEQALAAAEARLGRQALLLKHRVFDDALTKLALNSQLSLEELEETLTSFSQKQTTEQQAAIVRAAEGSVASTNPPSGATGESELNELREKMDVAMRESRMDGPGGFWELNIQYARLFEELKKK